MEVNELFFKEKPVKALLTIHQSRDEVYATRIGKEIDSTYAHTVRIIKRMEEKGLVESNRCGRKKLLELTRTGQKYADILDELFKTEQPGAPSEGMRVKSLSRD